jgi:hypothetical protein
MPRRLGSRRQGVVARSPVTSPGFRPADLATIFCVQCSTLVGTVSGASLFEIRHVPDDAFAAWASHLRDVLEHTILRESEVTRGRVGEDVLFQGDRRLFVFAVRGEGAFRIGFRPAEGCWPGMRPGPPEFWCTAVLCIAGPGTRPHVRARDRSSYTPKCSIHRKLRPARPKSRGPTTLSIL